MPAQRRLNCSLWGNTQTHSQRAVFNSPHTVQSLFIRVEGELRCGLTSPRASCFSSQMRCYILGISSSSSPSTHYPQKTSPYILALTFIAWAVYYLHIHARPVFLSHICTYCTCTESHLDNKESCKWSQVRSRSWEWQLNPVVSGAFFFKDYSWQS